MFRRTATQSFPQPSHIPNPQPPRTPAARPPRWERNRATARYLNVADMTLWRWKRDPDLAFPLPSEINGIEYNDLNLINDWLIARRVDRTKQNDEVPSLVQAEEGPDSEARPDQDGHKKVRGAYRKRKPEVVA